MLKQLFRFSGDTREVVLTWLVIIEVMLIVVFYLAISSGYFTPHPVFNIVVPIFAYVTLMAIIKELQLARKARTRKVEPLSYYINIQHRAKKFLGLHVPRKSKKLPYSLANRCIKAYARNGCVSLTDKQRTDISLEILETGISSGQSNDKTYYERERVAILENILAEKND